MGVRFPSQGSNTIVNTTLVTTAETVLFTTPGLNISLDFSQVLIFWWIMLTIGTGTTSFVPSIRRGTTTAGTRITLGAATTVTAGNAVSLSGCYPDIPGAVAGQQYSLTGTQNAATANGTVSDGALIVFAL